MKSHTAENQMKNCSPFLISIAVEETPNLIKDRPRFSENFMIVLIRATISQVLVVRCPPGKLVIQNIFAHFRTNTLRNIVFRKYLLCCFVVGIQKSVCSFIIYLAKLNVYAIFERQKTLLILKYDNDKGERVCQKAVCL